MKTGHWVTATAVVKWDFTFVIQSTLYPPNTVAPNFTVITVFQFACRYQHCLDIVIEKRAISSKILGCMSRRSINYSRLWYIREKDIFNGITERFYLASSDNCWMTQDLSIACFGKFSFCLVHKCPQFTWWLARQWRFSTRFYGCRDAHAVDPPRTGSYTPTRTVSPADYYKGIDRLPRSLFFSSIRAFTVTKK